MTTFLIIIFCVSLIGYMLNNAKKKDKKSSPPQHFSRATETSTKKTKLETKISSEFGDFKDHESYQKAMDKALDTENLTQTSLERFDKLTNAVLDIDKEDMANAIGNAFENRCEEKTPLGVLQTFDKLNKEHPCISFAIENGAEDSFISAISDSLQNEMPEKNLRKNILEVLTTNHPLMKKFREKDANELADWADAQCEKLWPDWEGAEYPDVPANKFLEAVTKCLEAKQGPQELAQMLKEYK